MTRQPIYMESTEIPPERTAAEIGVELVKAGASKIMHDYDDQRELVAVTFAIRRADGIEIPFRLPIRTDPIFKVIQSRRRFRAWEFKEKDLAQAKRTAWRQVYRWIQAQVAMIQTGMVRTEEVFLPYMFQRGQTLYQALEQRQFQALPGPVEKT